MAEAVTEKVTRARAIWLVPVIALLLGIYLVVDSYLSQGPVVVVFFPDAAGIEPEQTKVRALSVEIGMVTEVELSPDLDGVQVTMELKPSTNRLLRDDTSFWVVTARVGAGGITGLGTILSGAYIELNPGVGDQTGKRKFDGLESAPITDAGRPGIHLGLVSSDAGIISVGNQILYRGFPVGRVETAELDIEEEAMRYSIFIDAPYDALVSSATRFWNASGVSAKFSADGLEIGIESIQTLVSGGVTFHDFDRKGTLVAQRTEFKLHANRQAAEEDPFRYYVDYAVSFKQSLRGLRPGAPVEFRGVRIGEVRQIMLKESVDEPALDATETPIPVLIRIEPGRMAVGDDATGIERMRRAIAGGVEIGLRAQLATGNLLTGARFVTFDYFPGDDPAAIGEFAGYPTLPTIQGGLAGIEHQITKLLEKINALPIEQTVVGANDNLAEFERTLSAVTGTLNDLREIVGTDAARNLPVSLDATLTELSTAVSTLSPDLQRTVTELNGTLENLRLLTRQLDEKPNAIIFPARHQADTQPRASGNE